MPKQWQRMVGPAAIAVVTALTLDSWLVWTGILPQILGLFSFALLCLLLSWLLDFLGQAETRPEPVLAGAPALRLEVVPTARARAAERDTPRPIANAFSIDLEDYFHTEVASQTVHYSEWSAMPSRIRSSVLRLLDLLDEHETKSTVFVLGWIADRYPSLIRQVAERGHEIGCHSYRHRQVFRLDRETFYDDTRMARQALENATGSAVCGYRAPNFSIIPGTEWAFDVLAELGFLYDSSVHPVHHKTYGNPGAPRHPHLLSGSGLLEIPVATWRIAGTNLPIGGGAYLRILPYQYIHAGLSYVNRREAQPATVYMHPWEIDVYQPPLGLPWKSHFRQNWGVHRMESRLGRLLSSFRFAPMAEVYSHLLSTAKPSVSFSAARRRMLVEVAN